MASRFVKFIKNNDDKDISLEEVCFVNGIELVTVSYIMKSMGCIRDTISKWEKKGLARSELSERGMPLFDIKMLRKWYKNNIDHKQAARTSKNKVVEIEDDDDNPFAHLDIDSVPQQEAERRKSIESVKKLVLQNRLLDGESISITASDKNLATQAATHISHLTNSEKILPDLLENKSASDIQEILNDHNQMNIEQLYRLTNNELTGEHELFDIFYKIIEKIDDGVDIEAIYEGMDKLVVS